MRLVVPDAGALACTGNAVPGCGHGCARCISDPRSGGTGGAAEAGGGGAEAFGQPALRRCGRGGRGEGRPFLADGHSRGGGWRLLVRGWTPFVEGADGDGGLFRADGLGGHGGVSSVVLVGGGCEAASMLSTCTPSRFDPRPLSHTVMLPTGKLASGGVAGWRG